jgi:hypothetical protein
MGVTHGPLPLLQWNAVIGMYEVWERDTRTLMCGVNDMQMLETVMHGPFNSCSEM